MKISVALCTYNGAQYIEEQLRSILTQTMPVGEIVICDDGSSDDTIAIVEKISTTTTIPIRIYVNETNLGFVENFYKAIKLCCGELIFLSDQDDKWMPNKTEIIHQWFIDNSQKDVVFTDAILMDECSLPIMKSKIPNAPRTTIKGVDEPLMLWESIGFSRLSQKQFDMGIAFELWVKQNRATGATMAIKKSFLETIKVDYDCDNLYHDFVISIMALMRNSLGYITEPLIYYRKHLSQKIGCSLAFPKCIGYDDARHWESCCEGVELLPIEEDFKSRLSFGPKRVLLKHSIFALGIIVNVSNYIKIYRKNWYQMFWYDLSKSIKHNIKRMLRKL